MLVQSLQKCQDPEELISRGMTKAPLDITPRFHCPLLTAHHAQSHSISNNLQKIYKAVLGSPMQWRTEHLKMHLIED